MADYTIAEERLISGKGVLKVSADDDNFRHAYLILDVIRNPTQPYLNNNWNPPRAKYAFLTFRRNEYVIGNAYMEWERQMYDTVPDITSQNLIAIKCQYQGVLQSFANLGDALGVNPVSITDLIKDYESLSLQWDEVLIKCYADTAIQARLYYLLDDTCSLESRKRKRIPPPPPPLPKVPPGTAIGDISSPYNPDGSDDGNTQPYPGDEIPPPPVTPPGDACVKYRVVIEYEQAYGTPLTTKEIICYGEIGEPFISPSGGARAVVLPCRGYAFPSLDEGCQSGLVNRTVFVSDSVAVDATPEIILFEEYAP